MKIPSRVFISYSHDSDEHRDLVLALADRLIEWGIPCELDQYEQPPVEGWGKWTRDQLEAAEKVLVICTKAYRRRFDEKEEEGRGKGVRWEARLICQEIYEQSLTGKYIPIVMRESDGEHLPAPLAGVHYYCPFTEQGLDEAGLEALYRRLTDQPDVPKPELGRPVSLPPRGRHPGFTPAEAVLGPEPPAADAEHQAQPSPEPPEPQPSPPETGGVDIRPHPGPNRWLLLALGAALLVLAGWWYLGRKPPPESPFDLKVRHFELMPYALTNALELRPELYWLALDFENRTGELVDLVLECTVSSSKPNATCEPGKIPNFDRVPAKGRISRTVDALRILMGKPRPGDRGFVRFKITVYDSQGTELDYTAPPVTIAVAPADEYYWKLKLNETSNAGVLEFDDDSGALPDSNLMLATLASWTLVPGNETSALARALSSGLTDFGDFVGRVYREVLASGSEYVTVTSTAPAFPPQTVVRIRPPDRVHGQQISPLEAAVLFGALAREALDLTGASLVMVSTSRPGGEGSIYLAWQTTGGWQALDLENCALPFEDNRSRATAEIADHLALIESSPSLAQRGVYVSEDERLVAIDFAKAQSFYSLPALPD